MSGLHTKSTTFDYQGCARGMRDGVEVLFSCRAVPMASLGFRSMVVKFLLGGDHFLVMRRFIHNKG